MITTPKRRPNRIGKLPTSTSPLANAMLPAWVKAVDSIGGQSGTKASKYLCVNLSNVQDWGRARQQVDPSNRLDRHGGERTSTSAPTSLPGLMTVTEAASWLALSPKTIRRLLARGELT